MGFIKDGKRETSFGSVHPVVSAKFEMTRDTWVNYISIHSLKERYH